MSTLPPPLDDELPLLEPTLTGPPAPASALTGTEFLPVESDAIPAGPVPPKWTTGTLTYTGATLATLFFFLLAGDFALSMRDRSVGPLVQLMLKRFDASDTVMAILLATLPPALSLVIGPIVSFKSDRLRSTWGRRIPFLLFSAPIAALAMIGIAYCREMGDLLNRSLGHFSPGANGSALLVFGLMWTGFECAVVTAASVMGGLINDVVPRGFLGRFYALFRIVSLAAGMIFNYSLGLADTHYRMLLIGIAALFLIGMVVMCLYVREGKYPPVEDSDPLAARRRSAAVKLYFRESFSEGYYWWVFIALALASVTFLPINLFSLPYADQIHLSHDSYGKLISLTYAFSLAFAWPMGWLVDRIHALAVAVGAMAVYAVTMFAAGLLVQNAWTFGFFLVVHGVLSGCYFTASASLGQALFPRMKFGQYASAGGLVASLLTMMLGPSLGKALDLTNHNYRMTFFVGGALGMAALFTLLLVQRMKQKREGSSTDSHG